MAQLVEDNRRLQSTISKLRDTTSSQTAKLEEELVSKTRSVEILQEKLSAQSDYDEVKRELRSVYLFISTPFLYFSPFVVLFLLVVLMSCIFIIIVCIQSDEFMCAFVRWKSVLTPHVDYRTTIDVQPLSTFIV